MAGDPGLSLTALADPASLDQVHALLEAVWGAHEDVGPTDRTSFAIAVSEIAGNIVVHGDGDRERDFSIRIRVRPEQLEAEFEDTGQRVDVDLAAVQMPDDLAESGRGLALTLRCV